MKEQLLKRKLNPFLLITTVLVLAILAGVSVWSQTTISEKVSTTQSLQQELNNKTQTLKDVRSENKNLRNKISQMENTIEQKESTLEQKNQRIGSLEGQVSELESRIESLEQKYSGLNSTVRELNMTVLDLNSSMGTICSTGNFSSSEITTICEVHGHEVE